MNNTIYISIPKQEYDLVEENFKTLKKEFETFKEECNKDSKYIIISEHYDILNHLDYRCKNNPFLGCSKEDYIKTYKGTTYEDFLNELIVSLENTHGKIIDNIVNHLQKSTKSVKNSSEKGNKIKRILQIIKE